MSVLKHIRVFNYSFLVMVCKACARNKQYTGNYRDLSPQSLPGAPDPRPLGRIGVQPVCAGMQGAARQQLRGACPGDGPAEACVA